jgi:hypothetical protein
MTKTYHGSEVRTFETAQTAYRYAQKHIQKQEAR